MIRSFGVLAVGEGIARLLSFLAIIWMTRRLSLDGFGLVALGGNLVVWFAIIVNSSTERIGLRDASRAPERFKAILEPVLGVRLALSLIAMAILAVTALVVGKSAEDREVLLLFILVLPMLSLNLRFSLLAIGSARAVAVANVASQLLFAGGVFVLVTGPDDAIYVPLAQAAGELAFALILFVRVAPQFGLLRPRIDPPAWREHLNETAPLMATQTGSATINWFDSFLIAILLGQAQVGLYSAAYKPILFLSYSVALLFVSFLASYTAAQSDEARYMLLSRTLRLSSTLSLAVAVVLSAGSSPLVSILFGEAYADSAVPLAILAWTIPLFAVGSVFGIVLISNNRQVVMMRNTLAGTALNVSTNFFAVPVVGIEGAAVVTVASILLVSSLNYRSCLRLGHAPPLAALLSGRAAAPAGVAR